MATFRRTIIIFCHFADKKTLGMLQHILFKNYATGPEIKEKTLNKICHECLLAFKQEM